jgi:uncharacterized protein YjbI with pentapeptide repeats
MTSQQYLTNRFVAATKGPRCMLHFAVALFPLFAFASDASADIFQWEYINPADPGQGKQQSTTLAPGGAGVNAVPAAYLAGRDLSMAYLIGADLTNAKLGSKIESTGQLYINPPLSSSPDLARRVRPYSGPLKFIDFRDARLTDADFTGADVRGASFSRGFCSPDTLCSHNYAGGGITLEQLYSTASYQAHDLHGIDLTGNILAGGNFAGQNLININFTNASLTDANFTAADIKGATFSAIVEGTGLTPVQLYSTTTYKTHDLSGIGLAGNDLTAGGFAGFPIERPLLRRDVDRYRLFRRRYMRRKLRRLRIHRIGCHSRSGNRDQSRATLFYRQLPGP